jgi:signal transduction histidine kinase
VRVWRSLDNDGRVALAIRLGLFLVCLASAAAAHGTDRLIWFAPIAGAIVLATVAPRSRASVLTVGILDGIVAAIAVVGSGGQNSPVLPYLMAPGAATAMRIGELGAVPPAGASALVLLSGPLSNDIHNFRAYSAAAAQWVVLALLVGLATGRIQSTVRRQVGADQNESYAAAYHLLSQLRTVARHLSSGLDPVTLSDGLLEAMHAVVPFDRGAVYGRSQGGRLVPLAIRGTDRIDWDVGLSGDNAFAEAWASQRAAVSSRAHRSLSDSRRRPGSSVAVPLRAGVRTIGIVGLEATVPWQLNNASLAALEQVADEYGLRLETALLFDEVREVATVEERRRLAREIHDGIAQELASLGYVIDGMSAEADDDNLQQQLNRLRQELSRIISEIRLSIFDLRSEVDQFGGLGAALSEYVRSVGAQSRLRVHLSLDEGPARLPADVEAELLRIAQEAITNARKHANAGNLWVYCSVEPPSAWLRVEDDGVGLQTGREDSFGIEIMRERAARLRARLDISPREAGGTVVEVALGAKWDADTVAVPRNR